MPPTQRGHVRKLPSGKWQLRYYDARGEHRSGGVFGSRSAAFKQYREKIEPKLLGLQSDLTLLELHLYIEQHSKIRQPKTIAALRDRLKRSRTHGTATVGLGSLVCRTTFPELS